MKEETNNKLAPIAVFVYNRPDLTRRTLEALARNREASDSLLYIFCDGPKIDAANEQRERIRKVREVVRLQKWCGSVIIIESEINKGLAGSIIDGVTKVIKEWDKVIVLEDDLTVSPYFLQFINQGLNMYEREDKALAIHGYLYPLPLPSSLKESSFFIRDPGSLGWGTWKRAWDLFEPDTPKLFDLIRLKRLSKPFNFLGRISLYENTQTADGRRSRLVGYSLESSSIFTR